MSSGADLFVVCKQCGSEVSPYITECPYCGHRLRRRAPKLPRVGEEPVGSARRRRGPSLPRMNRGAPVGIGAAERPYATILLVLVSCGVWVAAHANPLDAVELMVIGPLRGDWWRLFTYQFTYLNGYYEFFTLAAVALFGWLLERRHGPLVVIVVFLAAGVTGAMASLALYALPVLSGANAGALALLGAWVLPDLEDARAARHYEGDLLGVAAIAAVLLAMPLARVEAGWPAGVLGGVLGLVLGYGLSRTRAGLS